MPNRIPTPGTKTPAVRKSPAAIAPAKAKSQGGMKINTEADMRKAYAKVGNDVTKIKGFNGGKGTA